MKKFLFFICFGVVFQVQARLVNMAKENTQYAENYYSDTLFCKDFPESDTGKLPFGFKDSYISGALFDFLAYCMSKGVYESASFDGPYALGISHATEAECDHYGGDIYGYNQGCSITIIIPDETFYTAVVNSHCTYVTVKGSDAKGDGIISWSFGSPFIYTQNSPSQNLQITINSPFNNYHNQLPAFNTKNGWQVIADNNKFIVEQKPQNHLFYELSMNKITLNRNGQNFASQEDLTNYLQNSDFFIKLGLNETQKANSLNYILPQLPVSNNYYLTILSDSAIQEISELNINPAPKQLNRVYYAIYPTANQVKINDDLIFTTIKPTNEFTILESGEILVKPEMFVFWE